MPAISCEKTVLGKTLAQVLTLPASVELDTIGELVVFNNDLRPKTDEEFRAAVSQAVSDLRIPINLHRFGNPTTHNMGELCKEAHWDKWENREGQDYAEALERRVAEFRMPPRPLSSDGNAMLALNAEMKSQGWRCEFGDEPGCLPYGYFSQGGPLDSADFVQEAETSPLASLRAAIRARWDEVAA